MKTAGWVVAVVVAVGVGGMARADGAAKPFDAAAAWKSKCAACHGPAAKGNPKMLKMLKTDAAALDLTDAASQKKTDAELAKIVTDGVPNTKMVAFGKKFSADEINALVALIRKLATPAKS